MRRLQDINNIPHLDPELSREIHRVPLWRALRWLIVCIFRGPARAAKWL